MHISKYELMHLKEKKKFRSSPHSVNLHHQHFLIGGGGIRMFYEPALSFIV